MNQWDLCVNDLYVMEITDLEGRRVSQKLRRDYSAFRALCNVTKPIVRRCIDKLIEPAAANIIEDYLPTTIAII